jgi:hypothetical protein
MSGDYTTSGPYGRGDPFTGEREATLEAAPGRIAIRACVKAMLQHLEMFDDWTVQGFGMMRCYIPGPVYEKQFRLNIWDDRLAVPNVSTIHDHPWHFKSWIINGDFNNIRYVEDHFNGDPYDYKIIKTGVDATLQEDTRLKMNLRSTGIEFYHTGDTYRQEAEEIHCSAPARGTVTLNERTRVGDGEHARVFWPAGEEWVDAKPRKATTAEVISTTTLALENWT